MSQATGSSGFANRSNKTDILIASIERFVFTKSRYFHLPTGIEHRFGRHAARVHDILYRSMGPTTDLLRYFPDSLYFDRLHHWPEWEIKQTAPKKLHSPASIEQTGLFTFFVEYKFSDSERKRPLGGVPTRFIGIIEREAWLTYRRLTTPNPEWGLYLDEKRPRIALVYAALYAPALLYAGWEEWLQPIDDPAAVRREIARPNARAVGFSTGSGTPWINFDIRQLLPLERFLAEHLFWDEQEACAAVEACKAYWLAELKK